MSTINSILIKRRLPDSILTTLPILSGGELAFSEKNYTLYYGASGLGTIAIGGDGAFVNRTTSQTVDGDKTFNGTTTLSSTTFASNSVINGGANKITNILDPQNAQDAATKQYVDNLQSTISANFVDRSTNQTVSGEKTFEDNLTINADAIINGTLDVGSSIGANSYTIDGYEVIASNRSATFTDVTATGNVTISGNLVVQGETTTINTSVTTTSAFDITNNGTGPALIVTQVDGSSDVAKFNDASTTALIIKGDGNVGINTNTPNEKLTVIGNITASGNVFGTNADFIGTLDVDQRVSFGSSLTITSNITGTANSSQLINFIIDGGSF
jgi:hypothetical protein